MLEPQIKRRYLEQMVQMTKGLVLALAASTVLAACGDPEIVVPDVLSVTIMPAHGSIDISRDVEVLAYFSHPVADPAAAADQMSLQCLGAPPCSAPSSTCTGTTETTVTFEANAQSAHLAPTVSLLATTCYRVSVGKGIKAGDPNVADLPVDITPVFVTGS